MELGVDRVSFYVYSHVKPQSLEPGIKDEPVKGWYTWTRSVKCRKTQTSYSLFERVKYSPPLLGIESPLLPYLVHIPHESCRGRGPDRSPHGQ